MTMKNIFLLLFVLSSFACLAQPGSLSQSVYRTRVNDSTAAKSANTSPHSNGYADLWWNNQASPAQWMFWNGSNYERFSSFTTGLPYWPLTGTGTLTGDVTIAGNFFVGIGGTPSYKLDLLGTANNQNIIRVRTDDGANILSSNESSGTVVFQLGPAAYGFFGSFGQNAYMYAGSNILQINPSTIIHGVTGVTSSQSFWGTIAYTGDLSPAQITANQNNYSPGSAGWYRLSSDASRNITGWIPVVGDGDILEVHNVGSFDIVFTHEDTNSDAANRFLVPGGGILTVSAGESATWRYDTVTDRWRLVNYTG